MTQQKIVVLGGGESGVGAARLAQAKGFDVFLSDKSPLQPRYREALQAAGIAFEEGTHTEARILDAAEVVKSPGIPDKADMVKKIRAAGIPIVSEIEFAARYTRARIIAITGSNGKTTTTLLTHHLLRAAGLNAGLAGNVGNSFAELVIEDKYDWYVLEVSSFQLDGCYDFHPHIAILTNITPDHLDRYEYDFDKYVAAKFRITRNLAFGDFFIFHSGSEVIEGPERLGSVKKANWVEVSTDEDYIYGDLVEDLNQIGWVQPTPLLRDIFLAFPYEGDFRFYLERGEVGMPKPLTFTIPTSSLLLKGRHNQCNAMMAMTVAGLLGIDKDDIEAGLWTFKNAPHRLEKVGERQGVAFVNDSKATNVDSVFYALDSFKQPVVWIAGGVDKGNDYAQIETLVRQKVKALICLGRDNTKLLDFFTGKVPAIHQTHDIREAVALGLRLASPGDTVLLSPACASFDLFRNYEDRGDQFRAAVLGL